MLKPRGQTSLEALTSLLETALITVTGAILKLGCGFLFVFYSNYGRICSRLRASNNGVTLKIGLGFVQGHWKWHHLIDRIRVPISVPSNHGAISYRLRDIATYW